MLKPRRIRGASSLFVLLSRLAAFISVLLAPSPAYSWSDNSGDFFLFALVYVTFFKLLPYVLLVLFILLLFWLLPGSKNGSHQTKQHDLETRTIELTDEHRRIMERFDVTYEDGKFHYDGKAYDSLSDVPLK